MNAPRTLPPLVAAALFSTAEWAGFGDTNDTGLPWLQGYLPEHLRVFDGFVWSSSWCGDREGVHLSAACATHVRFDPPSGFPEFCDAMAATAESLGPILRKRILPIVPDLDFESIDPTTILEGLLADFRCNFYSVGAGVWSGLCREANTAHGRIRLKAELMRLEGVR